MPFWMSLYIWIDRFLIFFYRLFDSPSLGYCFGTAVLCLMCVMLGQLTLAAVFLWNRRRIDEDNREMVRMHNLSVKALMAKDKGAYKACNKEANEAFGKVFFTQIAMSLSSLWPAPFALAWMQTRFSAVAFDLPVRLPFIGQSVGYLFSAIPIYILMYILFGRIKSKLPFFRKVARILAEYDHTEGDEMIRMAELPRESARRSQMP